MPKAAPKAAPELVPPLLLVAPLIGFVGVLLRMFAVLALTGPEPGEEDDVGLVTVEPPEGLGDAKAPEDAGLVPVEPPEELGAAVAPGDLQHGPASRRSYFLQTGETQKSTRSLMMEMFCQLKAP